MFGVGRLNDCTYITQAAESVRSAAATAAGLPVAALDRGLDLCGKLRARSEAVDRRAVEDLHQPLDRGLGGLPVNQIGA